MNESLLHRMMTLAGKALVIVEQDESQAMESDPLTNPATDAADVELNAQAWDLLKEFAAIASSRSTIASVLAEHENHRVHVSGPWTTDVRTADTVNTSPEELRTQYEGFSVCCLRCKVSVSDQWAA